MNGTSFDMSTRKYLKTLGVTVQREIEKAARQAPSDGKLKDVERSVVETRIKIPAWRSILTSMASSRFAETA